MIPLVEVTDVSSGRWALRRLRAILRQEGLHGAGCRALALLGWRRYVVYVRSLQETVAHQTPIPQVEIDELDPEHMKHYVAFRPGSPSEFGDRLQAGYTCFAAWENDRIVAVTWIVAGTIWIEHLRRAYLLDPDEIYVTDSLTDAKQRGRRLSATIFETIVATYRERGYRQAIGLIAPYNRSSIRSRERSGFRRIGVIGSLPGKPIRTSNFQSALANRGD